MDCIMETKRMKDIEKKLKDMEDRMKRSSRLLLRVPK